ncbi:hypothetical protein V8F33_008386 [Rhypophila sp. PSN 637]
MPLSIYVIDYFHGWTTICFSLFICFAHKSFLSEGAGGRGGRPRGTSHFSMNIMALITLSISILHRRWFSWLSILISGRFHILSGDIGRDHP